jgi:hypothetical protein
MTSLQETRSDAKKVQIAKSARIPLEVYCNMISYCTWGRFNSSPHPSVVKTFEAQLGGHEGAYTSMQK